MIEIVVKINSEKILNPQKTDMSLSLTHFYNTFTDKSYCLALWFLANLFSQRPIFKIFTRTFFVTTQDPKLDPSAFNKKFALCHADMCFIEILKVLERECAATDKVRRAIDTLKSSYSEIMNAIVSEYCEKPLNHNLKLENKELEARN